MKPADHPQDPKAWNPQARWVRILQQRANGMVEFEFAVGEPQLYVEMVMAGEAFAEFCAMHGVTPTQGALPPATAGSAEHEWDWNLREARERHFRHEP
jgi:phenol hydroxylase P0 protein